VNPATETRPTALPIASPTLSTRRRHPGPPSVTVPALVAVAHGTRDERGVATVRALLDEVRTMRPELPVVESYVEITPPSLTAALTSLNRPAVVVPLLLGAGFHVKTDLPRAIEGTTAEAVAVPALGPHALLADALLDRLIEAGWQEGDTLVLAAAGSSDPAACADARLAAHLLSERVGTWITTAYLSAARPTLAEAVEAIRRTSLPGKRIAVAPYLLAPGYFYDQVAKVAADVIAAPLGAHPAVAQLVLTRYDATAGVGSRAGLEATVWPTVPTRRLPFG
jgi:sirohydrochlorin ferrochelatase